jgi:putative ABC transport system permease protein
MRNVTFKGILAHKTRLALTAIAIMLGVAFISGTYILTDTLHNTFSVLVSSIYSKIDFQIRGVPQLAGDGATRKELPQPLLAKVSRLPGVRAADGTVQGYAQFVARNGNPISTGGAPTLGVSFDRHPQVSTLRVIAGGPPKTSDDVVIDAGTAQQHGFKVGERVRILLAGPSRTFTISGIAQFGTVNNLAGITLAAFTLPTAQHLFNDRLADLRADRPVRGRLHDLQHVLDQRRSAHQGAGTPADRRSQPAPDLPVGAH